MKPGLLPTIAVLAVATLAWSGSSAFGGNHHGGGGGGSDSGSSVLSGGGGGGGNSGGGGRGGSLGSGSRRYAGGMSSRASHFSPSGYGSTGKFGGYRVYGSHALRTQASNRPMRLSSNTSRLHVAHKQSGLSEGNRFGNQLKNSASRREEGGVTNRRALTSADGKIQLANLSRRNPANKNRFDQQTQTRLRNFQGKKSTLAEARQRHRGDQKNEHNGHCHHNHDWWHHHCHAIILVDWGYWGWWDGWWYPAWGYDPYYSSYECDEPIYSYDGLPPDEVVADVQTELQRRGYYTYTVDGVLGPTTKAAITRYQRDRHLSITGSVDPATVGSLGLSN